ncbi:hypothetical protein BDK61_1309 [Haloarcula quadrata]|uniref:Uncharacterized protein n=1 Tax=Haloarcula quadrata TaxID=182779 RepID=A0A495R431_9EURY|nr:hypothetical protein BDK61_1309 [Haloarcula quadrata]
MDIERLKPLILEYSSCCVLAHKSGKEFLGSLEKLAMRKL